jgi:hypothetical protein
VNVTTIEGFDVSAWLSSLGMGEFGLASGDLISVGDMELGWYIAERDGVVVERTSRGGPRAGRGSFSDVGTAVRYLMIEVAGGVRSDRRLRRLAAPTPAGAVVEDGPTAVHVRWPEGWAELHSDLSASRRARLLARAVLRPLGEVADSCLDPGGSPLFTVA